MDYIMYEMPDIHKTGEKKFYPRVNHVTCILHDTIVSLFVENTLIPRNSIESVMRELPDVLNTYLSNGHSVKIDGFGTFEVILGQLSEEDVEDAEARQKVGANQSGVYIKKINFSPDRNWLRRLRDITELHLVKSPKEKFGMSSTVEERRQIALEYLETHPFMQVGDYMRRTGLSRSKATRELNAFCADPESGIKAEGNGSHKVYVKRG